MYEIKETRFHRLASRRRGAGILDPAAGAGASLGDGPCFRYSSLLRGTPQTMSAMVQSIGSKGTVAVNGVQPVVADGLPNSEICATLGLSAHTAKNHLSHLYENLECPTVSSCFSTL